MSDNVFIFGAGFSSAAKVPNQIEILKNIGRLKILGIKDVRSKSSESKISIDALYKDVFNITEINDYYKVPLEDIFTYLDKILISREAPVHASLNKIEDTLGAFKYIISYKINHIQNKLLQKKLSKKNKDIGDIYYNFFKYLVDKRLTCKEKDCFSIITMNWDTIPDYYITKIIHDINKSSIINARIDYNCYDYPIYIANNDECKISDNKKIYKIPSIFLKAKGICNIKL
ncbi:MAG: hypothetical protein HQK99_06780 [Nitrospirae bacterium]|nr:hypothetical protein [Nitrospirota bacterium]